jgi:hydroxypyruvate isomerase
MSTEFKPSLCLEMLFQDRPFVERMEAASRLGYRAIEFWDWKDKDIAAVAQAAARLQLTIAAISGNRRHSLIDPESRAGLIEEMDQIFEVARRLNCRHIMMLSDVLEQDGSAAAARQLSEKEKLDSVAEGLLALAGRIDQKDLTLLLEPLNTILDHKGCFLDSSTAGATVVEHVNSPRVKLLYDVYHMSMMGEDAPGEIAKKSKWIGYVHVADMPGRHEPGTGAIDYGAVRRALNGCGYKGFVGMEFSARTSDEEAVRKSLEVFS